MAIPVYQGSGGFGAGTSTVSTAQGLTMPAGVAADDILLLICESENQAIALSTSQGFVEVTNSPQGTGTAGSSGSTRLAVFWKRAVGGDSSPVIADAGDHVTGQIHRFSGCITTGDPWDVTAGGVDTSADTSGSIPGATTTVADCLIVLACSTSNNATSTANFSNYTNADLAAVTEQQDHSNTAGLGGGHGMATGEKATAGSYTTTSVTLAASSLKGMMSIALKPASNDITVTPGSGSPVFAGLAAAALLTIRIATGLGAPVFTGQAPTVLISVTIPTGLGQPVFTGQSPAVQIGAATIVQPGTATPVFTGFAPTRLVTVKIPVGLGAPVFSGLAPTAAVSNNQRVTPGVGAPVFAGIAPSVVAAVTAKPGTGDITVDSFAPLAVLSDNQIALPDLGQPVFAGIAPTVLVGTGAAALATPGLGQVALTGYAPVVLGSLWDYIAIHRSTGAIPSPHRSTGSARTFTGESITRTYTAALDDPTKTVSTTLLDCSESPGMG